MTYPTVAEIDACDEGTLLVLFETLRAPRTEEERDISERLGVRCEALGLVDSHGKRKEKKR